MVENLLEKVALELKELRENNKRLESKNQSLKASNELLAKELEKLKKGIKELSSYDVPVVTESTKEYQKKQEFKFEWPDIEIVPNVWPLYPYYYFWPKPKYPQWSNYQIVWDNSKRHAVACNTAI